MLVEDGIWPLSCKIISWSLCEDGHVEYLIECKKSLHLNSNPWKVSRRYKDFYALNNELKVFGVELGLPGKKYIGSTNSTFINERKTELQRFLDVISAYPLLYCSIHAAIFLEYRNYDINELQQWITVAIRNRQDFAFKRDWECASWRYFKCHALLTHKSQTCVLSFMPYGPDAISEKEADCILKYLTKLASPFLCENLHCWADSRGLGVIRPMLPNGILRDILHKCKPDGTFLKKYKLNACYPLNPADIIFIGRQILESLIIFHSISYPFTDIHCGNVRINEVRCELLDYEFALTGQSSINHSAMIKSNKVKTVEDMMVFNFGFFLYEMLTGQIAPPEQDPEILLEKISDPFRTPLCYVFAKGRDRLPTLKELISFSMFNDIPLPGMRQAEIRITRNIREILQNLSVQKEKRLLEERKQYGLRTKIEAVQSLLISNKQSCNNFPAIKIFN